MNTREWIRHQASLLEDTILYETGIQAIVKVDYVEDETDYSVEKMFELVESVTGIERSRIRGNERYKDVVNARQIALYMTNKYVNGLTHGMLAKHFKRDRSTISVTLKRIGNLKVANDAFFMKELKRAELAFFNSKPKTHESTVN